MIVKDGFPYIIAAAVLGIAAGLLLHWVFFLLGGIVFISFVNFFRNPERPIPPGDVCVSPADGKVIVVHELNQDPEGYKHFVSIFMNVFDVHVNRAPIQGTIQSYEYMPGKFEPASKETAPIRNERNYILIRRDEFHLKMSQVAGLLARRIVFWKKPGDPVDKGERIGLIRFGSRVDLWLPDQLSLRVKTGDRVKAGSTIIAERTHGN
jgi:phosphatidylserine decarboxylase